MKDELWIFLSPEGAEGGGGTGKEGDPGKAGDAGAEGDNDKTTNDEGELPKFSEQITPELREKYQAELKALKGKKLNDVFEEYFSHKRKADRAVYLPDPKNPDPEEAKAFLKALGIPESPDKYALDVKKYEQELGKDALSALTETFKKKAHEISLTPKQAQQVLDEFLSVQTGARKTRQQKEAEYREKFMERLSKLEPDENNRNKVVNLYRKFLTQNVQDKEVIQKMNESGILYHEKFVRALAALQEKLEDERYVAGNDTDRSKQSLGAFGNNYSEEFRKTYGGGK